ncbi:hypothetical protein N9164_05265 [Draconibacterium sp.]|nr:hypothetical protein [Draconibacterium sp.]
MRKLFLVFALLVEITIVKAQYFQTGQDPASIKWRQINTENFQLIYPDYFEVEAQKLAHVMEKVYAYKSKSIQYKPEKISIILHTQTVQSNGLVAWAPKRSEFYTTPHQGIYAQEWLYQLAIHEFRHVIQIDKINSEIPKIIKILLGEQGTAGVFGIYFPWWFIEGDAVVTETALSNSGRGRFPSFLVEHQAQVVEKGIYSYDKAYNGSIKDYVPNHYQLGYYLVGAARQKYGTQFWSPVIDRVGKKPFSLNPFNKALKNSTGFTKVGLYNSVFDSLRNVWEEQDKKFKTSFFNVRSPQKKSYTNYKYNHWLNNSTTISYKTSLTEIPAFVAIDNSGIERKIIRPGIIFDESVNYRGDWIVWSERIPDFRWSHSGKSHIMLYNCVTLAKQKIKTEFKAFAPAISPSLRKVIVVETDYSSNYYLSVYNILNGQLIHRIQTEKNNYFFSPDWINEEEVVAVVLFDEGKRLARINLKTGKMTLLTKQELGEIKNLEVVNKQIYFTGSYSGKNAIYVFNLEDNSIHQIFEPRFGAESISISPNSKKLVLSDYTADGFQIIEIPLVELKTIPLKDLKKKNYELADNLRKQESGVLELLDLDTIKYDSKRYSKAAHLFNFHSWAPVSVDAGTYEIRPGVSLMSQNKLGTSITALGYEWDLAEQTGKIYGNYTFKGWYPVIDFGVSTGKRASEYYLIEETKTPDGQDVHQDTTLTRYTWNQTNLDISVSIPFNFSRGKFNRLIQPEINYEYSFYKHDDSTPEQFFKGNFQSLEYRLYFQQLERKSYQDVYPNLGVTADLSFYHSPAGDTDLGNMILGQSYLFLPGIMENHGIRVYAGFHNKAKVGNYSFSDAIRYPRGWGKINSNEMYSFAFDYKLPIIYPELSAGGLFYLKRVKSSLFADYAKLKGNYYENGNIAGNFNSTISSYGVELTGDMNFLRFYAPVEIGFRGAYLPEDNNVYFDFLLSIDFNSL